MTKAVSHAEPTTEGATLLYMVKVLELAVRTRIDELVRPAGITVNQYTALTVLERHPDLSSAQLARYSFVTPQSVSDLISSLEAGGLVVRHRDVVDRRRLVLTLTRKGHKLLGAHRGKVGALGVEMLSGLTPRQARELGPVLNACRTALTHPGVD